MFRTQKFCKNCGATFADDLCSPQKGSSMAGHRSGVFLLTFIGLLIVIRAAIALDQKEVDAVINKFLASKQTAQESAEPQDSAVADLNGDGKPEIVLVWRVLGPTYSRDNLTVFSTGPKGYTPEATISLTGQTKLSSVEDGIILVEQLVLGKNDPLCCPSVKKEVKYRWVDKKISEPK
jgi:hypothetical protein